MKRLFNTSAVARIAGLPIPTVTRRIRARGIPADFQLVTVSGLTEISTPLYAEENIPAIAKVISTPAPTRVAAPLAADVQ